MKDIKTITFHYDLDGTDFVITAEVIDVFSEKGGFMEITDVKIGGQSVSPEAFKKSYQALWLHAAHRLFDFGHPFFDGNRVS